jgi:hypothetical protein
MPTGVSCRGATLPQPVKKAGNKNKRHETTPAAPEPSLLLVASLPVDFIYDCTSFLWV